MSRIGAKRPKKKIAFVDQPAHRFSTIFSQNPQEYLENVEPNIEVADVLTSDKVASSPLRKFLDSLPEPDRHCSFVAIGVLISNVDLTTAYDMWQDIEQLRVTYFQMTVHELKDEVSS